MTEHNEQYQEDRLVWFTKDLLDEIDRVNNMLSGEMSQVLLAWIKDIILQLQDEYNDRGTD